MGGEGEGEGKADDLLEEEKGGQDADIRALLQKCHAKVEACEKTVETNSQNLKQLKDDFRQMKRQMTALGQMQHGTLSQLEQGLTQGTGRTGPSRQSPFF